MHIKVENYAIYSYCKTSLMNIVLARNKYFVRKVIKHRRAFIDKL